MSSSDSHRRRLIPRPLGRKCKQCNVEKAHPDRADGLGVKCASVIDKTREKAAKFAEQAKKG